MSDRKVAVVTGGSRGLGRAIAIRLAKDGADVAILYAGNEAAAKETVEAVKALGREARAYRCDVSDSAQVKEATDGILEVFGQVDILVNNAGITRDGLLLRMSEENFDAVLDTNLKGAFLMTKAFYGHMMRRRTGRIINISSVAGLTGNPGQANYSSAKAGLIGLTKTTAKELAARGVTCNAIAPGFIETDMTASLSGAVVEAAMASIPMKHMGSPEDVAAAAAFLASDAAGYITGEVIRVDGGLSM